MSENENGGEWAPLSCRLTGPVNFNDAAAIDALEIERNNLRSENERFKMALVTISLNDWYTRRVRQQENGGMRGMAGMLATRVLMGTNPSFIGNEPVIERFGDPRAALLSEARL